MLRMKIDYSVLFIEVVSMDKLYECSLGAANGPAGQETPTR